MEHANWFHDIEIFKDEHGVYCIDADGHGPESSCAVVSTVFAFMEAMLDRVGAAYEITSDPRRGRRKLVSVASDGRKVLSVGADVLMAASVCEPTRGYIFVKSSCDFRKNNTTERH